MTAARTTGRLIRERRSAGGAAGLLVDGVVGGGAVVSWCTRARRIGGCSGACHACSEQRGGGTTRDASPYRATVNGRAKTIPRSKKKNCRIAHRPHEPRQRCALWSLVGAATGDPRSAPVGQGATRTASPARGDCRHGPSCAGSLQAQAPAHTVYLLRMRTQAGRAGGAAVGAASDSEARGPSGCDVSWFDDGRCAEVAECCNGTAAGGSVLYYGRSSPRACTAARLIPAMSSKTRRVCAHTGT